MVITLIHVVEFAHAMVVSLPYMFCQTCEIKM